MSPTDAWLARRTPPPPRDLVPWLEGPDADGVLETLLLRARRALAAALAAPGRVRESAFHLLAADALFTYACEAALEDADPDRALRDVLTAAAAPDDR